MSSYCYLQATYEEIAITGNWITPAMGKRSSSLVLVEADAARYERPEHIDGDASTCDWTQVCVLYTCVRSPICTRVKAEMLHHGHIRDRLKQTRS